MTMPRILLLLAMLALAGRAHADQWDAAATRSGCKSFPCMYPSPSGKGTMRDFGDHVGSASERLAYEVPYHDELTEDDKRLLAEYALVDAADATLTVICLGKGFAEAGALSIVAGAHPAGWVVFAFKGAWYAGKWLHMRWERAHGITPVEYSPAMRVVNSVGAVSNLAMCVL